MRVLILGGDGYLGWPTAMSFSNKGHDVTVVDNYFRRTASTELDIEPLYGVPNLIERARIWNDLAGREIKVVIGDLTNAGLCRSLFDGSVKYDFGKSGFDGAPDVVIHYAEQPSAPYSMINHEKAIFTIQDNFILHHVPE